MCVYACGVSSTECLRVLMSAHVCVSVCVQEHGTAPRKQALFVGLCDCVCVHVCACVYKYSAQHHVWDVSSLAAGKKPVIPEELLREQCVPGALLSTQTQQESNGVTGPCDTVGQRTK